jgi:hypothetical protein
MDAPLARPLPCALTVALPANAKFTMTSTSTAARFSECFLYNFIRHPFRMTLKCP